MKIKYVILIFVLLVFNCCNDDKNHEIPNDLLNTWKLAGYINNLGTLININIPECNNCYTISFQQDRSGTAESLANEYIFTYEITKGNINFTNFGGTKIGEIGEIPSIFASYIPLSKTYRINNSQLYLYQSQNKYLLFNLIPH